MLPVSIYALGNSGEYTSGCILDCASEVKLFVAVNKTINSGQCGGKNL